MVSLHLAGNTVDLGTAELDTTASKLVAEGKLPAVTATDTRATDLGWSVSGTASPFTDAAKAELSGATLAWTPELVSTTTGQTATAGPSAADLTAGATLVSAPAGQGRGTAVSSADLLLEAPTNTNAGSYSATITLTLS